jgi:hypothetical protein
MELLNRIKDNFLEPPEVRAAQAAQEQKLPDHRAVRPERHDPERDQHDGGVARCHYYILSGQPIPDHELLGLAVMVQGGDVLLGRRPGKGRSRPSQGCRLASPAW